MVNYQKVYDYFMRGLAEFCANAIVLSLGCSGAVSTDIYVTSAVQLGFCFGLMVMAAYSTFWMISGAHISPAVTLAALIVGKIDWRNAFVYIPCQFLGAFVGCIAALLLVPDIAYFSEFTAEKFCVTIPNDRMGITSLQAFGVEFLTTSAWIFVMMSVWSRPEDSIKDHSALQVGFAVVTLTMLSTEITGASMSPARTLAPAVFHGVYEDIWVYMTAPLLAAVFVALLWKFFYEEQNLSQWTKRRDQIQNDA